MKTTEKKLSPWITLITRSVRSSDSPQTEVYHSFRQSDYVAVLAVTENGRIPVVRQFRPAMEKETLELPGGLLEKGENPQRCARRELLEETGYIAGKDFTLLGCLWPDTGRLENKLWCFFAGGVSRAGSEWKSENNVVPALLTPRELRRSIERGEFRHALHIAALGLGLIRGQFSFRGKGRV